ncbi:MAG: hypothetical protein U1E31_03290 [Rickettsiales bacterium]
MKLEIIDNINNLDKSILDIDKIIARTEVGEITILKNHCQLLTKVQNCKIFLQDISNQDQNIDSYNKKQKSIFIEFSDGILLVKDNNLQINCKNFLVKDTKN